jgi:histidyl-tRNA synthetase
MFQTVRGTHDILPQEARYLSEVERHAYKLARRWGFKEIRTPMFERADLFVRGLGVMAGLVERELWTFHDKHGQKLALRADMTACVVRAYHQHELAKQFGDLAKLFYVAPVFLLGKEGEQPSRQVQQFGLEVIGSDSPAVDVELLCVALEFCKGLDLEGRVELNSLGCDKCRPAYYDALREFFSTRQNDLCNTCKRKFRPHPTWTLSCAEEGCSALANLSPTVLGYLCGDCKNHFNHVKHLIKALDLEVNFNPRVVRDIEYYNRTCFRLLVNETVIGWGGRFDGLVSRFGGTDTPAAGFAIDLDETVELFALQATYDPDELDAVFLPEGDESMRVLMPTVHRLRQAGARVELVYKVGDQKPLTRYTIRLNEIDALRGQIEVLSTSSGRTEMVNQDRIQAHLSRILGLDEPEGEESGAAGGRHRRRLQRSGGRREATSVPRVAAAPGEAREWTRRQPAVVVDPNAPEPLEDANDQENGAESNDETSGRRRRRRRRHRGGEGENGAVEPRRNEAEGDHDEPELGDEEEDDEVGPESEVARRPEPARRNPAPQARRNGRGAEPGPAEARREPEEKEVRRPRERPIAAPAPVVRAEDQGKTFVPAFSLGVPAGKPPVFAAASALPKQNPIPGLSVIPAPLGMHAADGTPPPGAPRWSIVPKAGAPDNTLLRGTLSKGLEPEDHEDGEREQTQNEAIASSARGARSARGGGARRRH